MNNQPIISQSTFQQSNKNELPNTDSSDRIFLTSTVILSIIVMNFAIRGGFKAAFAFALIALMGSTLIYLRKQLTFSATSIACFISSFVITATFSVFLPSGFTVIKLFFILYVFSLGIFMSADIPYPKANSRYIFLAPIYFFEICILSIGDTVFALINDKKGSAKTVKILLSVLISIPVAIILIILLSNFNEAFFRLIVSIKLTALDFVSILYGAILTVFLFPTAFALKKGIVPEKYTSTSFKVSLDKIYVNSFLSVISFVYVVFLTSQLSYFFDAFGGILPFGYTYSEYANRSFAEMFIICGINVLLVFFASKLVKKDGNGKIPTFTKILTVFINSFSIFITVVSLTKMYMYITTYGFTYRRYMASVFMLILLFTLLAVLIKLLKVSFGYIKMIIIGACVIISAASIFDPLATTVYFNRFAYENKIHEDLDMEYISKECGDYAILVFADFSNSDDQIISKLAHFSVYHKGSTRSARLKDADFRNLTFADLYIDKVVKDTLK